MLLRWALPCPALSEPPWFRGRVGWLVLECVAVFLVYSWPHTLPLYQSHWRRKLCASLSCSQRGFVPFSVSVGGVEGGVCASLTRLAVVLSYVVVVVRCFV